MGNGITLYGNATSGNSLKPLWVAQKLGISVHWIDVDTLAGQTRTPEFLALNPAGQVPVAVLGDGRVLAQSNAIMAYLAEGSALVPADAFARAKMFEWLFWEQYSHEPYVAVRIALLAYRGKREDEIDPALAPKGHAALARMEQHLEGSDYMVGASLTLADIALLAYTRAAPKGGFALAPYPALRAWIARSEAALGLAPLTF